ncbi:hypothetical protein [Bacillus sp. COPE52]|uniref:hypothetical protein n=1 Tax=Bacillus sp. COPE52 TaxID=2233998 RepID=UPI000E10CC5E|nr:hypothetical protein [Bacillus sp. COPE52]AXK19161.1 hypothetical protein DPQ31_16255 [Bacillus sp. COPE52]
MPKKKRYFTKQIQKHEITLQEAWDVVSKHMEHESNYGGASTLFVDWHDVYGQGWYKPILHTAQGRIIVQASEKWGSKQ